MTSEPILSGATNGGLQEVLSGVAESIAAPVVFLTPSGEIEVINQRLLDFFGKTREEMESWKSSEIIHPDDRALTINALKRAMETGQPYEVEARRRRVDGEYRWWRSNGYPMRDAQGQILRWCVLYTDIDDKRKAEEALRRQEFLLSSLQESIAAPMSFWKPDGQLERVNQLALDYFGRRIDTIDDWKAIVHPDDDPPGYAKWLSAVSTGRAYYEELRLLRADGVYRWHDVRNFPMRDREGKIVRWCVIQIDIEDRKKTEEALAASERKLERIISTMPAMAWSANPDGTCDFFNQTHLDYVGLSLEEMQGIGFVKTFHPDDTSSMMAQWQVMLDSGRGGEVEGRIRRFDGEYRWFLFRTNPLLDASGKVTKWFGINVDIEDRKRALEQLRESEINLRQQTETIPQMLWGANADGSVAYCNSQMLSFTGRKADEIYGSGWLNNVHPHDREQSVAVWLAAVSTGKLYQTEVRVRRFDGEYRWCSVSALPLRDGTGAIIKWHGACVDIHDLRQTQDALAASERNLAQIISSVPAHAWTAKADGAVEFLNQHYLDYVGMTIEEAAGQGWRRAVHPNDLSDLLATWQSMLSSLRGGEAEVRMRRADGQYRWFLFRTVALLDDDGTVIKWFGINVDIEDRKRAEEALRASEQDLRRQTETIPQMLWSATKEGAIDYCNERLLEYSGLNSETVMNGGWVNLLHPDDREPTGKIWQRCIASGEPYTVEVRHFHIADRTYRWILTTALPLRNKDGQIVKWYGSCVDIHDRKLAEDALRTSERRLAQIIDAIPAYVWSARSDGGADYFNRHYLDYLGVPTEKVQGWNWASVVHPDDLDQHVAIWKRALEDGSLFESQTRLKGADGVYRWFLNRGSSLKDADGEVKWFGVTIDIEGMKRAEERLRESELNLRQLTETIPQNLWGATREGAVDYLNGHLKEWFGGSEGVMKDEWINLVHPEDRERTIHAWTSTVASGADYQQDVRFLHWRGQYRWCVVKGRPLRDETGNIIKWHGVVEDMQDWKQSQDELRETQSELAHVTRVMTMGQLTASIAHELNQPLSGIMTNAGTGLLMLNVDPPDIEGARDTAKRTMRDAQRASDVVTRLRALFSKRPTASEVVDVNMAVREVIALLSNELQRSDVTLRPLLSHDLPKIIGDRVQLQQVIVNFIVNAADAMSSVSGRPRDLTVSTELDGSGQVRVAVRDVGVGFDPADAERIFSPFYTTKPHGMGVGLSVSRTIIENHKGRLWAETNKGPGSTFFFSVPSMAGGATSETT